MFRLLKSWSRPRNWRPLLLLLAATSTLGVLSGMRQAPQSPAPGAEYLGKEVCSTCHEERASQHTGSNFEESWRPASILSPQDFPKTIEEGGVRHSIQNSAEGWIYEVQLPDRPAQRFPIHSIIGGKRFGLSFILEVTRIEDRPLPRKTLVEARYFLESGSNRLKLSPGFPAAAPSNYETAVGRVLSPQFADKCMDCHGGIVATALARQGGPRPLTIDTGVSCERCHGPGSGHLEAIENGSQDLRIIDPGKLKPVAAMELCGKCHSGFFPISNPRPHDLLISNQFNALSLSQCYIQSGQGFSCVTCHDPHADARHDDPAYLAACLSCHQKETAVICPVNSESGCVDCHMPVVDRPNNFRLRDHWIRVVRNAN